MTDRVILRRDGAKSARPDFAMSRLQDMPGVRQIAILLALTLTIGGGLWMFSWSQSPSYVPIYAELTGKDAAEISNALRRSGMDFKLDSSNGLITVPSAKLHEARMLLAAEGLPEVPATGIETIQGDQGFGASQFVESARYQHALETELVRTITSMRAVKDARVHLAIPKPSAFTRPQDQASASVMLTLYAGRALSQDQVDAVVYLVASSIAGLSAERVAVVDQSGRLLTQQNADSDNAMNTAQFEQARRLEGTYKQRIERLLEPLAGPGRISAQVTVDMDFAVTEEAREQFVPDPAKIRSEQTSQQSGGANANSALPANAQGVPGAASNAPATADAAAANSSSLTSASSATRNFELDRTLSHVVTPAGRVRRVTAAVLVDHLPVPAAADGEAPTARAISAEELTQIEKLVREAIGFDQARGDSVSVMNSPFVRDAETAEPTQPPFWEQEWLRDVLRSVFGGLAVIFLLFAVLKPAVRKLISPEADIPSRTEVTDLATAEATTVAALPPANSYEEKVQLAKLAVVQDPKRVAQLVKSWVGDEA